MESYKRKLKEAEAALKDEHKRRQDGTEKESEVDDRIWEEKERVRKLQELLEEQAEDNEMIKERLTYTDAELIDTKKKLKEHRKRAQEKESDLEAQRSESENKYRGELRKTSAEAKRRIDDSKIKINQLEARQIKNEELIRSYEGASMIIEQKARSTEISLEETEKELDEARQSLEEQRKQNLQHSGNWIPKDIHQKEKAQLMAQIETNTDAGRVARRLGIKEKGNVEKVTAIGDSLGAITEDT